MRRIRSCAFPLAIWLGVPLAAATLRWDARTLFDRAVIQHVRLSSDGSAVELDSGELVADDGPAAGFSYKPNLEPLSSGVVVRKQLLVADPRATSAMLLVGPGGKLTVRVNKQLQTLEPPRITGLQWQAYAISPAALKAGVNEILVSGAGGVWIARGDEFPGEWPHRSARSGDGGATWADDRLGPKSDIAGEYCVRLFLEHHAPRGTLLLPVIDAGELRAKIEAEAERPERISIRVRSGSTYVPGSGTWSEWAPLGRDGRVSSPRGRYVQLEITLLTPDPLQTPRLRALTLETTAPPAPGWTGRLRVVDAHNEEIVRTSIPFRYEPFDHPKLKELRRRYRLDEVVAGAKSEFELITRLSEWSAQRWKWAEWHLDESYPAWDALEILSIHPDGKPVGGFCQQYDLVFLQACESFGLVGRDVSISNGDKRQPPIEAGHEPMELWSNQFRKWIYVDGTNPWYAVDAASGVPLSLWELRSRQLRTLRGEAVEPTRIVIFGQAKHQWRSLAQDLGFAELRLIPRSNFLEQKTPLPLNQGRGAWSWDGHYVWNDEQSPAALIYGKRVTRHGDFEWTLNQAHYVLEPDAKPGVMRVHLDTETPGFETFLAEIDGTPAHRTERSFGWNLHPGRNRLRVWPRNNAGRDGIASWIELDWARE